jgi:hypothetical protein
MRPQPFIIGALAALFSSFTPLARAADFPTPCEVDAFLSDAEHLSARKRYEKATVFIARFGPPLDDHVPEHGSAILLWEYFLLRWADLFVRQQDAHLLSVVDNAATDGGFSTSKCSNFYRPLASEPTFRAYYASSGRRRRLEPCWRPDDLQKLLSTKAHGPAAPSRVALTACDVDQVINATAKSSSDRRTAELVDLVEKATARQMADRAGSTYLFGRLSAQARETPDEAIFRAVDTAAGRAFTTDLCIFYLFGGGTAAFARHYRDPGARALIMKCAIDPSAAEDIRSFLAK